MLMVRNEERYIAAVLRPLQRTFGHVIVGDTGSTDDTLRIVREMGAEVIEYGPQTPVGLTEVRQDLTDHVHARGCSWAFLVDGDELYCEKTLRWLESQDIPEGKRLGFTSMVSIDRDEAGQYWELDDRFNRQAFNTSDCIWRGEYPYESPSDWGDGSLYHHFDLPPGFRYHGLHLHRLERSSQDHEVYLRKKKQYQFSMTDVPGMLRTVPLDTNVWKLEG